MPRRSSTAGSPSLFGLVEGLLGAMMLLFFLPVAAVMALFQGPRGHRR